MRAACLTIALVNLLAAPSPGAAEELRFTRLMGWGGGPPATLVPAAADLGFTDLIVWNKDPQYLADLAARCAAAGVGSYASVHLADLADWRRRFPAQPPPLQQLDAAGQETLARVKAELASGVTPYQYGGEPVGDRDEVFADDLLCFHHPEVVAFFRAQLTGLLAVPQLTGVAFDYFGYRDYRCCRCPRSLELLAAWRRAHPEVDERTALERFGLESLVNVCNALADHARQVRPGCLVTGHVYPVFRPEPLYGNRLKWDFCGQTAAWFFEPFWSLEKIREYSRRMVTDADRYYPQATGGGLIGVYVRPGKYPVKGPERLAAELRAMREGGLTVVQVCSLNDVLTDAAAREVFRRFAPPRAAP